MYTHRGVILSIALLVACEREAELPTATSIPSREPQAATAKVAQERKAQLERFSTTPMLLTAERLGVSVIRGKAIKPKKTHTRSGPKRKLTDVPIATNPAAFEHEPSIAANPRKKKLLVVGHHFVTTGVRCQARHSSDGGKTWSAPILMPQLTAQSQCSDPVIAYSPDGSRVYYAYMDIKFFLIDDQVILDFDILVSYSTDNGATWIGPVLALDAVRGVFDYDKPWIGTPDDASNYVYLTATRFDATSPFDCHIVFARSTNGGTSYSAPQILDETAGGCSEGEVSAPLVHGSRPAGGKHGNVLVAWYYSGSDGFLIGSFNLRTRHSGDFGATFGPVVNAAIDGSETPFWLGPQACYERWYGSMFPDIELDPSGRAHIAYTHDPVPGSDTPEDGNIRYTTSRGSPYTSWSAPITVNDDGTASAQGYVALEIKAEGRGQSGNPHAVWMDHRLPLELVAGSQCLFAEDVENLEYDIFYSTRQASRWTPNVRVTDRSSLTSFLFVGDYIDLTTTNGSLFSVWADRRDKTSILDLEDDVWGGRIHRTQAVASR